MSRRATLPLPPLLICSVLLCAAGCGGAARTVRALPSSVMFTGGPALMWTPADPKVRAGPVTITVTSTGQVHDFVLEGVPDGSTGALYPGQSKVLHVVLHAGSFHFRCTYHPRMVGTLVAR